MGFSQLRYFIFLVILGLTSFAQQSNNSQVVDHTESELSPQPTTSRSVATALPQFPKALENLKTEATVSEIISALASDPELLKAFLEYEKALLSFGEKTDPEFVIAQKRIEKFSAAAKGIENVKKEGGKFESLLRAKLRGEKDVAISKEEEAAIKGLIDSNRIIKTYFTGASPQLKAWIFGCIEKADSGEELEAANAARNILQAIAALPGKEIRKVSEEVLAKYPTIKKEEKTPADLRLALAAHVEMKKGKVIASDLQRADVRAALDAQKSYIEYNNGWNRAMDVISGSLPVAKSGFKSVEEAKESLFKFATGENISWALGVKNSPTSTEAEKQNAGRFLDVVNEKTGGTLGVVARGQLNNVQGILGNESLVAGDRIKLPSFKSEVTFGDAAKTVKQEEVRFLKTPRQEEITGAADVDGALNAVATKANEKEGNEILKRDPSLASPSLYRIDPKTGQYTLLGRAISFPGEAKVKTAEPAKVEKVEERAEPARVEKVEAKPAEVEPTPADTSIGRMTTPEVPAKARVIAQPVIEVKTPPTGETVYKKMVIESDSGKEVFAYDSKTQGPVRTVTKPDASTMPSIKIPEGTSVEVVKTMARPGESIPLFSTQQSLDSLLFPRLGVLEPRTQLLLKGPKGDPIIFPQEPERLNSGRLLYPNDVPPIFQLNPQQPYGSSYFLPQRPSSSRYQLEMPESKVVMPEFKLFPTVEGTPKLRMRDLPEFELKGLPTLSNDKRLVLPLSPPKRTEGPAVPATRVTEFPSFEDGIPLKLVVPELPKTTRLPSEPAKKPEDNPAMDLEPIESGFQIPIQLFDPNSRE